MTLPDKLVGAAHELAEDSVYVHPVRQEEYTEPRYQHWWEGWLSTNRWTHFRGPRLQNLYRTVHHSDESYDGDSYWTWTTREFCGWDELLRPVNKRYREVEVDAPQRVTVKRTKSGLSLGDTDWWYGLPNGTYVAARIRNEDGELLWQVPLSSPQALTPTETFMLTNVTVTISH